MYLDVVVYILIVLIYIIVIIIITTNKLVQDMKKNIDTLVSKLLIILVTLC